MRDFTLQIYGRLLDALLDGGYECLTFERYCTLRQTGRPLPEKYAILRHDVDLRPGYSVRMAELEAAKAVRSSYYFRIGKESNQPDCIRRIALLKHEIGYHYEDMSLCAGDRQKAYAHFVDALEYFRQYYPVQTCCMHGAPMSKYDSRALWENNPADAGGEQQPAYSYRDLRLIGEPYYDVDFAQVLYLTDTGRCWDGYRYSLRDKVPEQQQRWLEAGWMFHATSDIIRAIKAGNLPDALMLTTHPQRWTDSCLPWMKEWLMQNIKNQVKRLMVRCRN